MSSNGNQKQVTKPVTQFVRQLGAREVISIKYTDLDGVEHDFGVRNTKDFIDYFIMINVMLVQQSASVPKGGYTA